MRRVTLLVPDKQCLSFVTMRGTEQRHIFEVMSLSKQLFEFDLSPMIDMIYPMRPDVSNSFY